LKPGEKLHRIFFGDVTLTLVNAEVILRSKNQRSRSLETTMSM